MDCELGRKPYSGKRLTFIHIPPTEVPPSEIHGMRGRTRLRTSRRNEYGVGWKVSKRLPDLLYPPNAMKEE
jgi:hypothetical protein